MSNYSITGSIVNQLFAAIQKNPEMTMGEIFHSFLNKKILGKNFVEASNNEIYTAIEKFNQEDTTDEPYDEQGFNFWVEQALIVKE